MIRSNQHTSYIVLALFVGLWMTSISCAKERVLRAGAGKVDITPDPGVSLDGPISKNGPVTGVNDPLYARAIVFDDGLDRLAIVVCDVCMIERDVVDAAKELAAKQANLPENRILIAATHTHAAPRASHIGTDPVDQQYHEELAIKIAAAIGIAVQNLAPAQIGYASFSRPDLIRCRRHLCEPNSVAVNPFGESGERIKSVSGRSSSVIEPAGPIDPQFSIVSVQHTDGTPLAILGNFSVHYCGGYKRGIVSADYFGQFAHALEAKLNKGERHPPFIGIMSNGTSGNTGAIEKGDRKYKPYEWLTLAGRMLADESLKAIRGLKYRSDVTLQMQESELELSVRRPNTARITWAKNILSNPDGPHPHRWSTVYAQEALLLRRYSPTRKIKLQAIRIGDIGIAAAPCEVFAETGLAIKKKSPLAKTFTMELSNGYGGYLPPAEQHALGGYETWPARSSFLEVNAEAKLRSELQRLLTRVAPVISFRETQSFPAPEAHQAVAVDEQHFYAITNRNIGKYRKLTGELISRRDSTNEVPLKHLNSGVVVNGKLYCAHSNWPTRPTSNSIEIWDTKSLKHITRKPFDEDQLAFTWVDRHEDAWWVVFAAYGDVDNVIRTRLVKYNDDWQQTASWHFPREVVERFTPNSNSGGSFGPDGLLYATGHDHPEVYALQVPEKGGTLKFVRTIPIRVFGQGIAWDRTDRGVLFGIRRKEKEVVASKVRYNQQTTQ